MLTGGTSGLSEKDVRLSLLNKTAGGLSGGYRKYLSAMLPRLANDQRVSALQCIVPEAWQAASWLPRTGVSMFAEYTSSRTARLPGTVIADISRFAPDVVFVPSERRFRYPHAPVVNLFRNLEPFLQDVRQGSALERLITIARRRDARQMLTETAGVIVPSSFVRTFLVEHENIPAERVSVVHYGSSDWRIDQGDSKPPHIVTHGRVRPGFLLTAGAIRPARGLEDTLNALATIRNRHGRVETLVVAGETTPRMGGYAASLKRLCRKLGVTEQVVWAGALRRPELYWCFEHCSAFLMTARTETFCNLAVEALAHGCMIVAADCTCLPEILSKAACYYQPGDFRRLADATLAAVSVSGDARARRARASRCRAGEFSWDMTAAKTLDVLAGAIRANVVRAT